MRSRLLGRFLTIAALLSLIVVVAPQPARAVDLGDRVRSASDYATGRGATFALAVLDRYTGEYQDNGAAAHTQIESASVMKVFIADYMLHRRDVGSLAISASDTAMLRSMLRSSDNAPANTFWSRFGANAIVNDVVARYGLTETAGTSNTRYWGNTRITAHDMVRYYQLMLDGSGGLSDYSRQFLLDELRASTPYGTDGDWQYFGLHDALPGESVIGQKQGWMCCVEGRIYRNSTGFIGPDARFVVAALTTEPSGMGRAHIEQSLTGALRAAFPASTMPHDLTLIGQAWLRSGGANGPLGQPTGSEVSFPAGDGAFRWYRGGAVYWSPSSGAHVMQGGILDTWVRQGFEQGPLRYPVSDELVIDNGTGRASWFQGGAIYWSPTTNAHLIPRGPLMDTWTGQGFERGSLGYPTSDPYAVTGGSTRQDFQGGSLLLAPDGTTTRVS